jgi:alpha-mannosidase
LKTVDEYYYGSRNDIQRATVQNILNAVIKELQFNPDRRFIYVEQAFFQRWYSEQSSQTQSVVKGLVARGQLEMINGAWCMHDEASPSFSDMIDNTALGHRWLLQEFNVTPRTTWQIVSFFN